jgi:putative membrane protein
MFAFLAHLILTALALLLVAKVVSGVQVEGFGPALLGALVLGIVNAIVRPVMVFLTFPLTLVTLGLFLFVVNALMLWLMAALVPGVRIQGFLPALLGSLLLTVLNIVIAALTWTAA